MKPDKCKTCGKDMEFVFNTLQICRRCELPKKWEDRTTEPMFSIDDGWCLPGEEKWNITPKGKQ